MEDDGRDLETLSRAASCRSANRLPDPRRRAGSHYLHRVRQEEQMKRAGAGGDAMGIDPHSEFGERSESFAKQYRFPWTASAGRLCG